jgi:hypothetical protein
MRILSSLSAMLFGAAAMAQPVFTNQSALLSHNASSGACMAVTDMDGDGLDDIVQLDMSTHVHVLYQNPDHTFVSYDYGEVDNSVQWGWAIADLDNDGHKDICSGVSTTRFLHITARGVYTLTDLDGPTIFTQCMTMADWNNDGRVDVFACNDVGPSNIWITNAAGTPVYDANAMPWATPACTGTAGDMSGNYGSTATDFDNDGDIDLHISHCRQGVNDPDDCRRWDRLFVNDGNGNYSDQAAAYGLENREQVWTSDFGDYDNDGDLDVFSTTHSTTMMLFENDGTGHYTNVTAGSGLEVSGFFLQGLFRDLDNDAYLDIMTGSAEYYMKGNGDGTFTQVDNVFPAAKTMHSFAFGDFNNDGFEDVYAGYGDGYVNGDPSFPDRLWMNTPNGNHWFNVNLRGVVSNRDAVGAKVIITGPWGTQVREVHAGESYGITNTFTCHFGLGQSAYVTTMTIQWPSGQVDTYNDLSADQSITVVEGTCISPNVSISLSGSPVVCTGGSGLTLDATTAGITAYTWSNNATTPSITVNAGGTYSVIVDDGTGCTGQASVFVTENPDETPTVSVAGETTICEMDNVVLSSSAASSYLWSNNATAQSITVNTAGTYTVTVQGLCGAFTSTPVTVQVLDAPDAPVTNDVSIPTPGTADLSATGTNVVWYDAATGGSQVGAGNNWTTPTLNNTTSFWCADQAQYGGEISYGGQTDRINTGMPGQYLSNNAYFLLFDADEDLVIKSVKVFANGTANRTIAVVDGNGNTVAEGVFSIPDGESRVDLDFAVPAGTGYGLRVVSNNPQLWRDGNGSNPTFPYALGTLGAITTTNVTGNNTLEYYYFFYDWEVQRPLVVCDGPRAEVLVTVGPVGMEDSEATGLRIFPVPAAGALTITWGNIQGVANVELIDLAGRVVLDRQLNAGENSIIDLAGLASGEYTLRVMHANGLAVRRVAVR